MVCISCTYKTYALILYPVGTLRLWHLPDCIELNVFDSQALTSSAKQIFYGQSSSPSKYQDSSSINHSIWKMNVTSTSDVFLAFSIYADRAHSIYLTTLTNLEKANNEQRKLTFDSKYGTIIDYCFSSNHLYILFDSHNLLTVDILSVLSCDKNEYVQDDDSSIGTMLTTKGFHLMNNINSLFKQLFKTRGDPGDSSYHKRKSQRLEEQEEKRRKKQEKQSTTNANV